MMSMPWDSLIQGVDEETGYVILDRASSAEDLREVYKTFFSNGVFLNEENAFQVTPSDGMSVIVAPGKCCIEGTVGWEIAYRQLVFQASTSQDRIDTIVLRWNANVEMRNIDLYVKTGVASDVPVRPTLTRSETVWELAIADVFIAKNTNAISAARITDTRLVTELCGVVTPFAEIDTTTFYNQIQAAIDEKIAEIDALANFTYLQGGFYALEADEDGDLYVYYDDEDNPPPLTLDGGNLYYTVGDNRLYLGNTGATPAGSVMAFAGENAPDGWLKCDGQEVSREDYSSLFAAIGTVYGEGDGETTFNVPDLSGRFVFGSSSTHELASEGGSETVTLTVEEMPSHYHGVEGRYGGIGNGGSIQRGWSGDTASQQINTRGSGASHPHNNMPPFVTMTYIISTGR